MTGLLQGAVLTLCIWIELKDRRAKKQTAPANIAGDEHEAESDENTALLGNKR